MLGSVIHRQSLTDNVKDTCMTVRYIDSCYHSSFLSSPFCRGGTPQRPGGLLKASVLPRKAGLHLNPGVLAHRSL